MLTITLTSLAVGAAGALAATSNGTNGFVSFAQGRGDRQVILYDNQPEVLTSPLPVGDLRGQQWEIADGQLRSFHMHCAYPAIGPNWDDEVNPPANNAPYLVGIRVEDCVFGQHNKWSWDGKHIKWDGAYCLGGLGNVVGEAKDVALMVDNTNGVLTEGNRVQLWLCSTYDNPNQLWSIREPSTN